MIRQGKSDMQWQIEFVGSWDGISGGGGGERRMWLDRGEWGEYGSVFSFENGAGEVGFDGELREGVG